MATKRKKRRARKKASNPTKRTRTRKKRRHVAHAAPKRRRARRAASNPKRRRAKRRHVVRAHTVRRHLSNPKRRRHGKRRHRRNPGLPLWAMAGLAALLGLAAYGVAGAGSFALTQRLDPSLGTLERNRYVAAGLFTLAGIGLAFKSPLLGAGLAAGGLVSGAGAKLAIALGKVLDKKPAASDTPIAGYEALQGVYGNIGAYEAMQGVYGNIGGYLPMQGVYGNIGDFVPAPPWQGANPF